MKVGLHDAESTHFKKGKRFPNYALMKISAWHKRQGDTVEWWIPLYQYDRVYSSKVFDFTPVDPYLPEDAVRGGTGYRDIPLDKELPEEVEHMFPNYSIYPECDFAIGYLTRGCIRNCRWCIVPKKEGLIHSYRTWEEVVRPDSDKIVLMDNNILSCNHGIRQLEKLSETKYKIDINQGLDARLVTKDIAKILSRLHWVRFIRFSCDAKEQLDSVETAINYLREQGIKPYRIFIYLLITEDLIDAETRVMRLKQYQGINLYAQAERNPRLGIMPGKMQLEYQQRYMYSGRYRKETWNEYIARKGLWE